MPNCTGLLEAARALIVVIRELDEDGEIETMGLPLSPAEPLMVALVALETAVAGHGGAHSGGRRSG